MQRPFSLCCKVWILSGIEAVSVLIGGDMPCIVQDIFVCLAHALFVRWPGLRCFIAINMADAAACAHDRPARGGGVWTICVG